MESQSLNSNKSVEGDDLLENVPSFDIRKIELETEQDGDRLDKWLSLQLPDISRSRLQKLIESNNLILNGQVCTNKKIKLKVADQLVLKIPPPTKLELQPENIPLDVLYEDEHLIIINKQAGIVVHPAPGHPKGTLVNALLYHCNNLAGIGGVERPGIVHRLDKDTTGAMVVAKSDFAHQHLQQQIKAKTARREYWAVTCGSPQTDQGKIDLSIGRHYKDRKKMAIIPLEKGGRKAVTYWQVIKRFGNYTLIKFLLETGRTHQIRVHSTHLGYPLVGDRLYGSGGSLRINLVGQALHAYKLTLQHPLNGQRIEVVAPLPLDFSKLLRVLEQKK